MSRLLTIVALLSHTFMLCLAQEPELDKFITRGMKKSHVPGLAAAVVKNNSVLWDGYYGMANIKDKKPVTSDTLFQIASISKTITACAVMQQVEKGQLHLDRDLNEILPFNTGNPRHPGKTMTLRHLLTHTSGIRDNWDILEDTWVKNQDFPESLGNSLSEYFRKRGKYYFPERNFYRWSPGTKNGYTNVGTALAAYAAEISGNQSFEELCENHIFAPLKIRGSGFRLAEVNPANLAMPYKYQKKSSRYQALGHHGYLDFPAGSLRIKARDLAQFLLMFMGEGKLDGHRLLKRSTVEEMKRIQSPKIDPDQGLIWYYEKFGKNKMLGHNGGDPGVASMMFFDPKDGAGFIVLMNAEPKNSSFEDELAERLLNYTRSPLSDQAGGE